MLYKFSPLGISYLLFLHKNLYPKAFAAPMPPSLVAEPPIISTIFLHPYTIAFLISSPVPKVLVFIGFLYYILSNDNPEAFAISIYAIFFYFWKR